MVTSIGWMRRAERWLPQNLREGFLEGIRLAEGHAQPQAASHAE